MTAKTKTTTKTRRALMGQTTGQFVALSGDAVRSIVDNDLLDPGLDCWAVWSNQAPVLGFDATVITHRQRSALVELAVLRAKHYRDDTLVEIRDARDEQLVWRTILEKLDQGLVPPNEQRFFWYQPIGGHDFSRWVQAVEPNQALVEMAEDRLKRRMADERYRRRELKLLEERVNDTYLWVDVRTETTRTTIITPA
jgi:hypothetical protein